MASNPKAIIDDMVEKWLNIDPSLIENDPFLSAQKPEKGLLTPKYFDAMPEPFWGSTKSNLAVVINMNPGFTDEDNNKGYQPDNVVLSRSKMRPLLDAAGGYSTYAESFPQLCPNPLHQASSDWWLKKRMPWLNRIVEKKTGFKNSEVNGFPKLKPFALELVPWHSKKWTEAKLTSSQSDWMRDVLIPLACEALKGSKLNYILMFGNSKKTRSILEQIGFENQKEWNKDNKLPYWPKNSDGSLVSHAFIIWKHQDLGIKIFNMTANNATPPSSEFDEFYDKDIFPLL